MDEIIIPRKVDDNLMMVQELGHFAEYGVQVLARKHARDKIERRIIANI